MGVVSCSDREHQQHQTSAAQLTEKIELGIGQSGRQEVVMVTNGDCDVMKRGDRNSDVLEEVVMVTGGAGFLGQHIVKLLSERASNVKEIRVFDTRPWRNKLGMLA